MGDWISTAARRLLLLSTVAFGCTALVFFLGNTSLWLSHGDARQFADYMVEGHRSGSFLGVLSRDFRSGLGHWPQMRVLITDLPLLTSFAFVGELSEWIYVSLWSLCLFLSIRFLALALGLGRATSDLSGVIALFAFILPSPLLLTRVTYMGNFFAQIALSSALLAVILHSANARGTRSAQPWICVAGVGLAAVISAGVSSLWAVVLMQAMLGWGLAWFAASSFSRTSTRLWPWTLAGTVLLLYFAVLLRLLLGSVSTNLSEFAQKPAADQSFGLRLLSYLNVSYLGSYADQAYRGLVLLACVGAVLWAWTHGQRLFAVFSGLVTMVLVGYGLVQPLILRLVGIEIGPAPFYLETIMWLPVQVVAIAMLTQGIGEQFLASPRIRKFSVPVPVKALMQMSPAVVLVLWTSVWVVNNASLRGGAVSYPVKSGQAVTSIVGTRDWDNSTFGGRVMVIQPTSPDEKLIFPQSRASDLREQLISQGIPVLNLNSHLASPEFVAAMHQWFTNRSRPFLRAWAVPEVLDVTLSRMLGVKFVVSPTSLEVNTNLRLIGEFDDGFVYEFVETNLGSYSPTRVRVEPDLVQARALFTSGEVDPQLEVVTATEVGPLTPAANASMSANRGLIEVKAETFGRSLLVLPVEYSTCMELLGVNQNAKILRVNYLLTGLLIEESATYQISVRKNPYSLNSCF